MFPLAQILAMRLVIKDMEGIAVGFFLKCSNQIFTSYIKNGFIYFSYVFHWISWIGSINVCTSNNLHWAYENGKQQDRSLYFMQILEIIVDISNLSYLPLFYENIQLCFFSLHSLKWRVVLIYHISPRTIINAIKFLNELTFEQIFLNMRKLTCTRQKSKLSVIGISLFFTERVSYGNSPQIIIYLAIWRG